jgi:hypothetical protein
MLKDVRAVTEPHPSPPDSAPEEAKSLRSGVLIEPSLLKRIKEYMVERERENAPVAQGLKDLVAEPATTPSEPSASAASALPAAVASPAGSVSAPPAEPRVNYGATSAALWGAKTRATACNTKSGPRLGGTVALILEPSGNVSNVVMDGTFEGSDEGRCVKEAFQDVRVPEFKGAPLKILWSFTVPKEEPPPGAAPGVPQGSP